MKTLLSTTLLFGLLQVACTPPESTNPPDTTAPVLELLSGTDTLYVGETWEEPGYKCTDDVDGDGSAVTVSGSVPAGRTGEYTLTYTATDNAGNSSTAERTIYVLAARDLWAFYPCNGTAEDSGSSNRHCENQGANFTIDRFRDEKMAADFSTSGAVIKRTGLQGFPSGNCPKTICGWFRSTSTEALQSLFGTGNAVAEYNFTITRGPAGTKNQFRINGWGDSYDWRTGVDAAPYFDGKWHFCAVTYDTITTKFYLDGELKSETSKFRYRTDPEKGLVVMGMEIDFKGWQFKGALDDIRIFTRALTPIQVTALFLEKDWDGNSPVDTAKKDTTQTADTSSTTIPKIVVSHEISGSESSLQLTLRWNAIDNAFSYGVYYNEGEIVTKNDYYRIALSNSKTFGSELTVGKTYTFAVVSLDDQGTESGLSTPLTIRFSLP